MKSLDPQFQSALAAESTCIAYCWLIDRTDNVRVAFTSLDLTFDIGTVTFYPYTGFTPTSDRNAEGLEKNNSQDLQGLLTSEQIGSEELIAGVYDGARVTCFLVDVTNLPFSIIAPGPPKLLTLYQRYIKMSSQTDLGFTLELRDDDYLLENKLGKQTSKFCEHNLGDAGCGVDLTPYTFSSTVEDVTSSYQFQLGGSFTPGQFDRGKITFNTGNNATVVRDIKSNEGNNFTLWQPLPFAIDFGDEVTIVQGCGKTLFDCVTRYNNAVNSDSEPHIPTTDQAINTPIE